MAKKQQSTQQPDRTVRKQEERLWNKPSRPITPTPADTPTQPAQPTQPPAQPAQPPAQPAPTQPAPDPKPSTEK